MNTTVDVLAKIIRQRYDQSPPGKWPTEDSLAEFILEHAVAAGLVIAELPGPDSTRYEGEEHEPMDRLAWVADEFAISQWYPAEVQIDRSGPDDGGLFWPVCAPVHADDAKRLGLALLAASHAAQTAEVS